ncbi:glutamyl aminopeptidase isoform X1 [Diachasma alloeum]|uniref:glutamyl aminopeptidase isoform X1 n=1 Tax=Diachasma alloeum TaxID=454923 RepID=UPI0007384BD2|nr:glutamyl aminopeptidase isoform X1 [Diachasma alloeum]XP_015116431.1 glutamyl aminopeptidase isoform X1 [Diachasma alloeum]
MNDTGHVTPPRRDYCGNVAGGSRTQNFIRKNQLDSPAFICLSCFCIVLGLICTLTITLLIITQSSQTPHDPDSPQAYSRMTSKDQSTDIRFRLSPAVKPIDYDLYLHPDLVQGTFSGHVTILIRVESKRNYIALHQKDLNITKASLRTFDREENHEIPIKDRYTVEALEELVVTFNEDIPDGMYQLAFDFEGALQPDKIVGFYASRYKDEHGQNKVIATSKFEPTYARRAFPCFDEPSFKAHFTIKLVHPTGDGYHALSSMNAESAVINEPDLGLTTVTFAKSVPMSTYLICFIVSDFVSVTAPARKLNETETFTISVYTTRAQKDKAAFALDIGVKIIEFYTKLFRIDYPLPKLDMAAIPDFVSGAMENWGLITYREARLLYDKQTSSTADQEGIVQVIAHEFAHMWFGNLVTMGWWHDLWLNEGFASYMQYKSADAILPDWGVMNRFLPETLHPVFITDAKLSSHPIVQTVANPDEITAIFDVITYSKGASVLRMLDNFVGSETFNWGVTTYLNQFEYSNAETADLFRILQTSAGNKINITAIMDTWTRQMGFPVVNVTRKGTTFTLTQKRFLADPDAVYDPTESDYGYKWTIPITYITDQNAVPTLIWFDKDAPKLEIKLPEPAEWVKFNHDQVGYYRVNYDIQEWNSFVEVLQSHHKRLSISDRTSLIEDAFSLAHACQLDYTIALSMTSYLEKEQSATPWRVAAAKLKDIDKLLASTDVLPKYRQYLRKLVDSPYHDVTWQVDEFEDHDTRRLRSSVLNLACTVGHTECLDDVGEIFKKWIDDVRDVRPHPDIREAVYKYGMSHVGKEAEWNVMFQRFIDETDASEKLNLQRGLAGVQSSSLLSKFIGIAVDEKHVRSQDTFGCLLAISRNPIGTPLVWDWVRENWEFLVKRYTLNDRYLGQLVPGIAASFATEIKLQELKAFFDKYPEAGAGKAYRARALETVANNIKWVKINSEKIDRWLDSVIKW